MATVYQRYFGQFVLNDANGNDTFRVYEGAGNTAVNIPAGNYYLDGYTGETTAQLCNAMETALRTLSAHGDDNCYMSGDTVKIETNGLCQIAWDDAPLGSILGFSGTTANARTHTSDQNPKYTWHPSVAASQYPTSLHHWFEPETKTKYYRASGGTVHSVAGPTLHSAKVSYRMLPDSEVVKAASPVNKSFEEFYNDVFATGKPFRIYPDKAYNNSASYYTAILGEAEPKTFRDYARRSIETYQGYWDVEFPMWKDI